MLCSRKPQPPLVFFTEEMTSRLVGGIKALEGATEPLSLLKKHKQGYVVAGKDNAVTATADVAALGPAPVVTSTRTSTGTSTGQEQRKRQCKRDRVAFDVSEDSDVPRVSDNSDVSEGSDDSEGVRPRRRKLDLRHHDEERLARVMEKVCEPLITRLVGQVMQSIIDNNNNNNNVPLPLKAELLQPPPLLPQNPLIPLNPPHAKPTKTRSWAKLQVLILYRLCSRLRVLDVPDASHDWDRIRGRAQALADKCQPGQTQRLVRGCPTRHRHAC